MTDYDLMNTGILGVGMDPYTVPGSEFVDESTDVPYEDRIMEMADRERMEELMRLASMEQYPAEEEEEGNLLTNLLNPQNILQAGLSTVARQKLGWLAGIPGLLFSSFGGSGLGNRLRGGVSQNAFEQARNQRRTQSRIDYMMDRRAAGKDYSETNLKNLLQQTGQQDTWQPPTPTPRVPDFITGGGGRSEPPGTGSGGQGPAGGATQSGGGYSGPGAGVGRSGPPGRNYNIGGLAGLWQRS